MRKTIVLTLALCLLFAGVLCRADDADTGEAAPAKKLCALTFDDGPRADVTPEILDVLDAYGVKATFFVLGNKIEGNEEILRRMEAAGHEIGCHTWDHSNMVRAGVNYSRQNFERWKEALNTALGHEYPVTLLRPPGGNRDAKVDNLTKEFGVCEILWSCDTIDWEHKNTEKTLKNLKKGIEDGGIVLMHDRVANTAKALPLIIEYLQGEGYEMVTVTELLTRNGEEPVPGQRYRRMPPAAESDTQS